MTAVVAAAGMVEAGDAVGVVLALGWACVVGTVASNALRRSTRRLPDVPVGTAGTRTSAAPPPAPTAVTRAVTSLGRMLRHAVGRPDPAVPGAPGAAWPPGPPGPPGLSGVTVDDPEVQAESEAGDRRTGWAALAGGLLLVVAPVLAAVPVTWAVAGPVLTARRERARCEASLVDQLPDVVDLLALTAAAGLPVAASLVAIGPRPGGPLGEAIARAGAHVRHGGSTSDALSLLADAGPAVRPLADALVQHDRYGTPLLPGLQRVGIEARARRRRAAEEAARRLPVTLLFPLVLTTFPAFVLLTVVPLLAGSLGSLSLTPI